MQKKWKILLTISTILVVGFGSFFGIYYLLNLQDDDDNNGDENDFPSGPPSLSFPFAETNVLITLDPFTWDNETEIGHNGIDFGINDTATILATCNMTCNDKSLFYNELGGHWQAGCSFTYNDDFEIFYAFESFAQNETYGQIQLDAITVEIGQKVTQGEIIGQLFMHEPSAHIHFMIQRKFRPVCPYLYFNTVAKSIFDTLWPLIGTGTHPCNSTSLLCFH
jgi:hypothetical protein